jgi:hypothetical protein
MWIVTAVDFRGLPHCATGGRKIFRNHKRAAAGCGILDVCAIIESPRVWPMTGSLLGVRGLREGRRVRVVCDAGG